MDQKSIPSENVTDDQLGDLPKSLLTDAMIEALGGSA